MLLKIVLVALVFVAVHGQAIDNPEDRVANKPIVRARRGAAEGIMEDLVAMPHGPMNGRQRRSSEPLSDSDKKRLEEIQEKVAEAMKMVEKYRKN
ncbi:hypothetical protein Q1695_010928 [Nippostrongylus brasiliensis]|nr:hypothetical protein Q1695_010928 [Nippostrongylus brasiliensis]